MKKSAFLLVTLLGASSLAEDFPDAVTRTRLFDRFVAEMERIDGEGLPARANRPESWKTTIQRLRTEARNAKNAIDYGQVFHRLDMTYTNLHAQVTTHPDYEIAPDRKRPGISVRFRPERISRGQKKFKYRISSLSKSMLQDMPAADRPEVGDELLKINDKDIQDWARENFIFCKFPYREQCETNFFDSFRKGFLGWDWRQPLNYTLKRSQRVWTVSVPVGSPPTAPTPAAATAPAEEPAETTSACPGGDDRFPQFQPVYRGYNLCVYESEKYPHIAVLHLTSFSYRGVDEKAPIHSVGSEVKAFTDGYWRAKAPTTKKLIIDLIDNGGGNIPVPWYQILLDKKFQEQYVQFKKTPEFENDDIRQLLFYEDPAKRIWFEKLKTSGTYAKYKTGDFLPPIPQFCANESLSCEIGRYEPTPYKFKGQVRILVNEWCISSCTGFAWNLKDKLRSRVKLIGMPDSGDSGYARLFVDAYLDPKSPEGFRVTTSARQPLSRQRLPEGALFRQQVSATRSTDEHGKIVSAIPAKVEHWVDREYQQSDDAWLAKAFQTALEK